MTALPKAVAAPSSSRTLERGVAPVRLPDSPRAAVSSCAPHRRCGGPRRHGLAALVDVRLSSGAHLVAGKEVSGFTNEEERAVRLDGVVPFLLEDRLKERGARFRGAPMWQVQVVTSDRLVTGQNPASSAAVARGVLDELGRLASSR